MHEFYTWYNPILSHLHFASQSSTYLHDISLLGILYIDTCRGERVIEQMKDVALSNGFIFDRDCQCAQPGWIYKKNGMELKILKNLRVFVLTVKGTPYSDKAENLQYAINRYGN